MKVLITDGLSPKGQKILKDNQIDFDIHHYEKDELIKVIPKYDGIIVRSATKVPREVIDAGEKLKLIGRAGAGIDNIDHQYARSKNIPVLNVPGANSHSVAELVFAHMFAMARFIPRANLTMRKGQWNKKEYKGIELAGKTLGIIGFGRIGKIVARLALALGMKVLVYDVEKVDTDLDVEFASKEHVLKQADFITLHTPKLDQPVIADRELGLMKNGAYLINCARGGVVDEHALIDALNSCRLAGAGIDVYVDEPTENMELVNNPKVSVTPHIGAATKEAQDRVGIQIAEKVAEALKSL